MSVSPTEGGFVTVDGVAPDSYPSTYAFGAPTSVLLEATSLPGYTFLYWNGCLNSEDNPLLVDINNMKSITAHFTPISGERSASIGNYVWIDANKNGIQDATESGLNGVSVELYNADGNLVDTTTTIDGNYRFTDLAAGSYYVLFGVPSPYIFSPKDQTSDDKDSDVDITGKTGVFTLSNETDYTAVDAGVYESHSVHQEIQPQEAQDLINSRPELLVIDVRETDEFCEQHIPGALNYPWNSGYFSNEYKRLPRYGEILIVCRSGHRSRHAAELLNSLGYRAVYNLETGMNSWAGETDTCFQQKPVLYFYHVAERNEWHTELGIVNTSGNQPLRGYLRAYNEEGSVVSESGEIVLVPHARKEIQVASFFENATDVSHVIFESDDTITDNVIGYITYYSDGKFRASIQAATPFSSYDINIPHVASTRNWVTGIAFFNTEPLIKDVTLEFNNGQRKTVEIPPLGHRSFSLRNLFNGQRQPDIQSASVINSDGILALEVFFGMGENADALAAIALNAPAPNILYYPTIVNDAQWWTGIVTGTKSGQASRLIVTAYSENGDILSSQSLNVNNERRFSGSATGLTLAGDADYLKIEGTEPLFGFELFGNGHRIGGLPGTIAKHRKGVFPIRAQTGETSLSIINTESVPGLITLYAYRDDGTLVETERISIEGYAKEFIQPSVFFSNDIHEATYFSFSSSTAVIAFQTSSSMNDKMLDTLPGS